MATGGRPLVIFDFDGTLVDTWDWLADEVVWGADHLGYKPVTREDLERLRSLGTREVFKELGITWWRLPRFARYLRRRAEARAGEMRPFDGVPELLENLHAAGFALAISSSNSEVVVRRVLGERLLRLVSRVDCGGSVFGKASKLRRVVRKCGADAARSVAVGDETRDLEAAESAGVGIVAVEWGYAAASLLRHVAPGRTVGTVADLERMLLASRPLGSGLEVRPRDPSDLAASWWKRRRGSL